MSGLDACLDIVGIMSREIFVAETADNVDLLAGIICGCQLAEERAQETASGRVPANIVNEIKDDARAILGPGWEAGAK